MMLELAIDLFKQAIEDFYKNESNLVEKEAIERACVSAFYFQSYLRP